ncbi:hypothetical protein TWF718_005068 [Orbilia javanica]|uniref:MACPF domain-containing protein n=1 Tax=Orbilia javanica TaxID=47235 RepID=A0AAN8RLH0_9PEZI
MPNVSTPCSSSKKLVFTADWKTSVHDSTTLEYYMSLLPEGQEILRLFKEHQRPSTTRDQKESTGESLQYIEVKTFKVQIMSSGSSTLEHFEPANLTEQQWDRILSDNRALHGYYHGCGELNIAKAPKRAFRIKSNTPHGPERPTLPSEKTEPKSIPANKGRDKLPMSAKDEANMKPVLPSIPPFYVYDDAEISVSEILYGFQIKLLEQGFSREIIGASLNAIIVPPSRDSLANNSNPSYPKHLSAVYNLPRVCVELDSDLLELTEECEADAYSVTDAEGVKKFYQKYGNKFATSFTLGGQLHSVWNLSGVDTEGISQMKNKMRIAAALTFGPSNNRGSVSFAGSGSTGSTLVGNAIPNEEVQIAWNARGGDPTLSYSPLEWASTVKNHRLWRLTNQQGFITIPQMIQEIKPEVYDHLLRHV